MNMKIILLAMALAPSLTVFAKDHGPQPLWLLRHQMPLLAFRELGTKSEDQLRGQNPQVWQKIIPPNHILWHMADLKLSPKLEKFLGPASTALVKAWSVTSIDSEAEVQNAKALLKFLDDSPGGVWIKWQLSLKYALDDKIPVAVDYLEDLLNSGQKVIGRDTLLMTAARMLYQTDKLDLAFKYYNQVPKNSDYWLDSLEEKAWISIRKNDYEGALGELKTVMNPLFYSQVGPESFFLAAFSNLKTCDYAGIFPILKEFKNNNEKRVDILEKLSETGSSPFVTQAVTKMAQEGVSWADLGADLIQKIPRYINRDELIKRALWKKSEGLREFNHARSLAKTNASLIPLLKDAQAILGEADHAISQRLKNLAKNDLEELKKSLVKMQLVETEAIHRMHVGQNFAQKNKASPKKNISKKGNVSFPLEDEEIWADEISHFEAKGPGCPTKEPRGT